MISFLNETQLRHLLARIGQEYEIYTTTQRNGHFVFDKLSDHKDILIPTPKADLTFKKIIWPDGLEFGEEEEKKMCFFGLTPCDAVALHLFIKTNKHNLPWLKREDLLIISSECKPDKDCFCSFFDNDFQVFDLHLQKEPEGFLAFSESAIGKKILGDIGAKSQKTSKKLRKPDDGKRLKPVAKKTLSEKIERRQSFENFWQGIAKNCFSCGACSTVCPLCFCIGQEFENAPSGECKRCQRWDSCFADNFSKIQHGFDLRPDTSDRLYNWYHHKFVRNFSDNKDFLCTGCGRCINACPAYLNQTRILQSILKIDEQDEIKI